MGDTRYYAARRLTLWRRDPRCYYCRQPTVLVCAIRWVCRNGRWQAVRGGSLPPDAATIEHLDSRLNPHRGNRRRRNRLVLACNQCNHRAGEHEDQAMTLRRYLA